jgi:hypothetical protein
VVTGCVYAAGATVAATGEVRRSLHSAGGTVTVSGPVAEDALLAGGKIGVEAPARVGRDLLFGGGSAQVGAPVGRNLLAGGDTVALSAPVGGDVRADVGTLRLATGASVAGALTYTSGNQAEMAPDASVAGPTQWLPRASQANGPTAPAQAAGGGALDWLRGLIGMLALGLVFVLLFPRFTAGVGGTLTSQPWPSLGIGAALLVGVPILAVLLFVLGLLIGGWWLGLMLLTMYPIAVIAGYVLTAAAVGHWLFDRFGKADWHRVWALLAGLVLLGLVGLVPVLGGVLLAIALMMGTGAAALVLVQANRGTRQVARGEPVAAPRMVPAPGPA